MSPPVVLIRLFRILLDYRRRSESVRTPPLRLWVESASCCNLRCAMCPNKDMPGKEKGVMRFELFRKIVDEARHFAHDMYLHHRGEPLLNPALFDMLAYAREAGLRTRMHTNGTLLDEAKARRLLDARPDLVSFSVDGFEKQAYERIRAGATFEVTTENILRLARLRAAAGQRTPYLVVEKIRFRRPDPPENAAAVAALRRAFLDAGVNEVIEKEEYTWAEERAPEAAAPRTAAACTFPWYAMVICADGTVTPCPQDFWAHLAMGNANEASLREIWNGERYRALRRQFRENVEAMPLCHKCDRLHRKQVGGVPYQYMISFLLDQLVGYNRLRQRLGTAERN